MGISKEPTADDDEAEIDGSRRSFLGKLIVGTAAVGIAPAACSVGSDSATGSPTPVILPTAEGVPDTPTDSSPTEQSPNQSADTPPAAQATTAQPAAVQQSGDERRDEALRVRNRATQLATDLDIVEHQSNGEERSDIGYALSFTKGLPHNYETGLAARPADFEQLVAAVENGSPQAFIATPLGPDEAFLTEPADSQLRGWESPAVGATFALVGPDPQAFTMPPAPAVGSAELTAEITEVYAQALLRDVPLTALQLDGPTNPSVDRAIEALNQLDWFDQDQTIPGLGAAELTRRRGNFTIQTAFRGLAPGETTGPYLSQLLLAGSALEDGSQSRSDGLLIYGAQTIDQRVRNADPVDFMTTWDEWFDIQNALKPAGYETYSGPRRFMTTPRDLATYVHTDALYQSYLNACLVLLGKPTPFDSGLPFRELDSVDHQQGFALFGEPHVLSMLVEVCSRALRCVLFQKFFVHRRLRPEALAARLEKADMLEIAGLAEMRDTIQDSTIGSDILALSADRTGTASLLLPMAFIEGSPMHPSYGAGHATIAGACTTVLKALFNHTHPMDISGSAFNAFVPNADGSALDVVPVLDVNGEPAGMTVEGELNKLASNIAIGRDWAGVHYFTDYWESLLLGQSIAIQILREHLVTYPGDWSLTLPTFQGDTIRLE